jgi:hypothetical protein
MKSIPPVSREQNPLSPTSRGRNSAGKKRTRGYADTLESFRGLAESIQGLNQQAVQEYAPIVEAILRSRSPDVDRIEHTLDGLVSFCGHEPALQLYKKLCRHYYSIDPVATAEHVRMYREMWDTKEEGGRK